MALRIFLWLLTAIPITAHAEAPPPIDGWGKLKFGMSVQEVMDAMPEAALYAVGGCKPEEMAQKGCTIFSDRIKAYRVIIEGLPFEVSAHADRFNRLYQVDLRYSSKSEESITLKTCKSYSIRALEGLEKRYGALSYMPNSPKVEASNKAHGYTSTEYKTKAGSVCELTTHAKNPYARFDCSNDLGAEEEYYANAERDGTTARTEMRASRPFLRLFGHAAKEQHCNIDIIYTAATMPKPEGAESSDTGAF